LRSAEGFASLFNCTRALFGLALASVWLAIALWPQDALMTGVGTLGIQLYGVIPEIHANSGQLPREEVMTALRNARFLVFTSECYENFPMTIVEAFAPGVPVICSRLGAMQEIVAGGRTGLHFTPGDPEDLAQKVERAWTHPDEMTEMGRAARAEYEAKYTAERNYEMLMEIYQRVLGARH
jgi:glycosyltransferase involved in cell wall biosynthesis